MKMVIENIVFNENGYSYKLKKVKITDPKQNVSGFIRIGCEYYEKIYSVY